MYENGVTTLPMTGVGVLISAQLAATSQVMLSLAVLFLTIGLALFLTARRRG
jgi:hypothetical protein